MKVSYLLILLSISTMSFGQTKKFKPTSDMHPIYPMVTTMEVELGEKVYYSGSVHGSVGIQKNAYSTDKDILGLINEHFAYNNKQKKGMTGDDAATTTFVFEALKKGKCKVIIKDEFRGEVKNKYEIEITVIEKSDKAPVANTKVRTEKFVPEKGMIQLIPLKNTQEVELGQKLFYGARVHGSVGNTAKVWSENSNVVKLIKTNFAYENDKNAEFSGGDAATKTFVFEAKELGKATIKIQELFRGELKNEYTITVTVVAKK
jgi:hypothetical protein